MARNSVSMSHAESLRKQYAKSKSIPREYPVEKTCFKCGKTKASSEFYKHHQMADGLLGKCKECTKKDASASYYSDIAKHQEYDLKRNATPKRKRQRIEYQRRRRARNPEKTRAYNLLNKAVRGGRVTRQPCEVCGELEVEAHHDDYSKPLDVRWLCVKHHRQHHGKMRYLT